MANVEASWHVTLLVECPECEDVFDLTDDDDFTDGEKHHWLESAENVDIECHECGHKFKADLVW